MTDISLDNLSGYVLFCKIDKGGSGEPEYSTEMILRDVYSLESKLPNPPLLTMAIDGAFTVEIDVDSAHQLLLILKSWLGQTVEDE